MAEHLSCSPSYVYKKLSTINLPARKKYISISDEELDSHVAKLHADFPNSGQQMMAAYLKVKGIVVQRSRIHAASLNRVDPRAVAKRWSQTVKRRVYAVPAPNSLWHMDGHMKLVRWKLVTHGCIDGYSCCVTYLHCSRDNSTLTVLKLFAEATTKYGFPSRTRSDHGRENYFVALFMEMVQGRNRGSHLTGESKHNERIERLWKDVFLQVISSFYEMFYSLEDYDLLNVEDPLDMEALHQVYLPEINRRLLMFQEAWNRHSVRTASHYSPHQMWVSGMLKSSSNYTSVDHVFSTRDVALDLRQALSHYGLSPDALGEIEDSYTNE
ncbi:hypothetical protein BSL78_10753 [Apostichopus japonicus]|uniref:Integrase catalytic domain-containing protein n=1 Tax=Stichopus japonicus TaxID=307972 RepID=A0A2G8KWH2_STIJA|nr:hypothetical protein BSL78_10753 [Apostichopus japonicus]